jgi:hypothetical protein
MTVAMIRDENQQYSRTKISPAAFATSRSNPDAPSTAALVCTPTIYRAL